MSSGEVMELFRPFVVFWARLILSENRVIKLKLIGYRSIDAVSLLTKISLKANSWERDSPKGPLAERISKEPSIVKLFLSVLFVSRVAGRVEAIDKLPFT